MNRDIKGRKIEVGLEINKFYYVKRCVVGYWCRVKLLVSFFKVVNNIVFYLDYFF